ncbi:MAG: hypothetical protein RIQ94_2914 [Pseudomonadota bacterium]
MDRSKGGLLYSNDPIKAGLEVLLNKNSKRQLPSFGEENPSEIILDIYAIIYLALTGLVYGIEQSSIKTVITQETKEVIEQWLEGINRENYVASMGIRENGSLCLQSVENIRQATQDIQKVFRLIIEKSEIIKPALVDMPPIMLHVQKIVDISVYSSMKLSISNNIPWLCIDEMLAGLFIASEWKQVNAIKLFTELGNLLEFEKKKEGLYLYAQEIIPYALTFRDIKLLSISNDKHSHYFLAKILFLHPKLFTDINTAVNCLAEILTSVLCKGFLTGQFIKGLRINSPTNNGYTERVFNACCYLIMQCDDSTSERKLAMLLCKLFVIFEHIPEMIRLIEVLATEFARGHFLSSPLINSYIKENFSINKL